MYVSPSRKAFLNPNLTLITIAVAFKVYDVDRDGYISNGELFLVLKMMVGNNLKVCPLTCPSASTLAIANTATQDQQLQQIVDKTIMEADQDGDGRLSFDEFAQMVSNTVRLSLSLLYHPPPPPHHAHRTL